jgi:hypothetical protein
MNNIKIVYTILSRKGKCRENWSSDNPTLFKSVHKIPPYNVGLQLRIS